MRHSHLFGLVCIGAVCALTTLTSADDWTQWRGPRGAGVSAETGWSAEGAEKPLWSRNVGLGYSSFVVKDGRVITAGYDDETKQDTIYCLDAKTGEPVWTHSYPAARHDNMHGGGTLSTPVFDGDCVFSLNREGRLFSLSAADGSVIWQKNLMHDFDLAYPRWMFSASPLVIDDMVLLNVGRLIAMDKQTGDVLWKTRQTGDAYSTAQAFTADGRQLVAVFNGEGLVVFDRSDGTEVGAHPWKTMFNINAATPVVINEHLFISSAYNHGCAMLGVKDDSLNVVWENKEMKTQLTGCVLWDGYLYGFDDATLKCIDTNGVDQWALRGLGNGSLMIADGRLIVISGKGELIIAEATPEEFRELSRRRVLEGGVYWTMPVLADGLVYVRNSLGDVVCLDHRGSNE